MSRLARICLLPTGFGALFLVAGCAEDVPAIRCVDPDFECYLDQAVKNINVVRSNVSYWAKVQFVGQLVVVVAGLLSTIMIALQGDDNRHWTRPLGLIATAIVTGMTSALVSFHVPENVDHLVNILEKMTAVTNQLDEAQSKLVAGRSREQVEREFSSNELFRTATATLTTKFAREWNKAKVDMLRVSGTASRLNTAPTSERAGVTKPGASEQRP